MRSDKRCLRRLGLKHRGGAEAPNNNQYGLRAENRRYIGLRQSVGVASPHNCKSDIGIPTLACMVCIVHVSMALQTLNLCLNN